MRVVLAAAATLAAATAAVAAPAPPRTATLYARPDGPIAAFAQDGAQIAWFAKDEKRCNTVHIRSLANGIDVALPSQSARNVTCRWDVTQPVRLALARGMPSVLWTLPERVPLSFDYVVGATAADRRERRFQELAHTSRGAGLWLGGVAGDGSTVVYAVTAVDYEDEAGCLAGTGSCAMKVAGGGIYRISGRQPPVLIEGTGPATAVAVSGGTVAYVPTADVGKGGVPMSAADLPIEVTGAATSQSVLSVRPQGTPVTIALAPHALATLERTPTGLRLAWYDPSSGVPLGSIAVPAATSPELGLSDRLAVFHVGRSIRAVELAGGRMLTLARAAADPIGLSVEGSRVAWAENPTGRGRIRAVYVGGRG